MKKVFVVHSICDKHYLVFQDQKKADEWIDHALAMSAKYSFPAQFDVIGWSKCSDDVSTRAKELPPGRFMIESLPHLFAQNEDTPRKVNLKHVNSKMAGCFRIAYQWPVMLFRRPGANGQKYSTAVVNTEVALGYFEQIGFRVNKTLAKEEHKARKDAGDQCLWAIDQDDIDHMQTMKELGKVTLTAKVKTKIGTEAPTVEKVAEIIDDIKAATDSL